MLLRPCVGLETGTMFRLHGFYLDFIGSSIGFRNNIMVSIFDIAQRDVISIPISQQFPNDFDVRIKLILKLYKI